MRNYIKTAFFYVCETANYFFFKKGKIKKHFESIRNTYMQAIPALPSKYVLAGNARIRDNRVSAFSQINSVRSQKMRWNAHPVARIIFVDM